MTAKYVDGTTPRPASRTVCYSKWLTIRLIVDRSYITCLHDQNESGFLGGLAIFSANQRFMKTLQIA